MLRKIVKQCMSMEHCLLLITNDVKTMISDEASSTQKFLYIAGPGNAVRRNRLNV